MFVVGAVVVAAILEMSKKLASKGLELEVCVGIAELVPAF